MTLHPWPLNDSSPRDHAAVLWAGHSGRGLLADSLAVPLCFMPDDAAQPAAVVASTGDSIAPQGFDSSALLRLRDVGCRLGAGAPWL